MSTIIKVLGCGGAGSNAVDRMIALDLDGIEFIAANTDKQALASSKAQKKIELGPRTTRGLGAGGQPTKGEQAAEESANQIADAVRGADMVFIAAGMGGGTGTGAAPVAARLAREAGAMTVGVVTMPFNFEATKRTLNAQSGITKLKQYCDTLIVVPNDKLLQILPRNTTFQEALSCADEVLRQGIQGIAELVTKPGLINVDFANVKSLMQLPGGTVFSMGEGRGGNKACEAVHGAFEHKLLEVESLRNACGVLVCFKGSNDLSLGEINQAMELVNQYVREDAQIVFGATLDETMMDRVQVILVATGVGGYVDEDAEAVAEIELPHPAAAAEAASPVMPARQPSLARSLFAAVQPVPQPVIAMPQMMSVEHQPDWEMATEQIPSSPNFTPDNLDIPAFMRRRMSLIRK